MTELEKALARIKELEAAAAKPTKKITFKVAEKSKAIQINGMRRFPIVLYRSEMEQLISLTPDIQAFIKANESSLALKPE